MEAELGSAVVSGVASKVTEICFDSIKREISYVFKYRSYIDGLKNQVKELQHKREMVEKSVDYAQRQGDEIYKAVEDWLKSVADFSENVIKPITVAYEDEAKKRCFKGLCPNLLKCYSLSKKAEKASKEGADLVGKGNFSTVSYRPAPEKTELVHFRGYEQFDSRLKVFKDVMETLKDSNIDMIGVYGMGGVGKTTLVKQVARKVIEDKLFDEVIMAEVTQTPDYKTIQDKIARDLGLEFGLHESVFQRADRLCVRLKKAKRVLVILDNIWTKLELDAVGIPFRDDENQRKDDQRGCTIILTSRTQDLLCNYMNSLKNFLVEVLSKEEAEQLFEKIVGDSAKQSDFQPIAGEIVRRCGGLPVALSTIANALKNKSLSIWKDALDQLRNFYPRKIHGMDANVYSPIELSYNFLESDEAKYLFLLCGLHQAGDSINIFTLMRYGMGLGLFKKVYKLETARNRVHGLIDSLKVSCLLLDGDTEDEVKMHDIIHVVAVTIASEKFMFNIQNVADLKDETIIKDSTAISVHYRDIQELPERLECPQLKLFLLSTKYNSSLQISYLLFEGMKQLKVLNFTKFHFPSLPSSLGCLINLQTLCFDSCQLENTAIVGQLKKLEILSFRGSYIKLLPVEIGQLTLLRLLDLRNCKGLEVIAPNVISKLSRLEELYIGDSFTQWEKAEGCGNFSFVDLKELSKLTTLDIRISDVEIIPPDLVSVELERYWICVGDKPRWYDYDIYKTSRFLKHDGLEKRVLLGDNGMKMLLKRAEDLYLMKLKGFQNVVHELEDGEGFSRLKHLRVENCYEILHIVSSVEQVHYKVFPLLESLFLDNLINLETVCHNQLTEDQLFCNLRIIKVNECHKLKHLFSFSMAKILLRLQKIEVRNCNNLEMIVGADMEKPPTTLGIKEIISEDDSLVKVIFPSLKELKLEWLSQFRGTSTSYCCQNLTKVTLKDCNGVKYLFSYSMVNSLVQLEHLDIVECESMEAVVVDTTSTGLGRDEENFIEMVFPKLNYLRFHRLPKLTSFAIVMDIHSVEFPSLLKLKIVGCHNLRRFISMRSSDDNNLTEMQPQPLFDENVRLPNLEELYLDFVENLRQIWHHQLTSHSLKVLRILHCSGLESIFPQTVVLPSLMTLDVSECHGLRNLMTFSTAESMVKLTRMEISLCEKMEQIIQEVGEEVKEDQVCVFSQLEYLKLTYLHSLKSFCLGNNTLEFSSLEQISMLGCPNMKTFFQGAFIAPKLHKVKLTYKNEEWYWEGNLNSTFQKMFKEMRDIYYLIGPDMEKPTTTLGFKEIIAEDDSLEKVIFPSLKELKLEWLNQFRGTSTSYCCQNLTKVILKKCNGVKYLFSYSMVNSLVQLEYLDIESCESMEAVVVDTTSTGLGRDERKFIEMVFPKLNYLRLSCLPKLESIFPPTVALPSLMTLYVDSCYGLRNLMTFSTAESMVKLTRMEICGCDKIEQIIQEVGEEVKEDQVCLGNYTLEFSSLEQFCVRECRNMKTFSQGVSLTPKLHKVTCNDKFSLSENEERYWEGNLNSTIQKMFKEMAGFRGTWYLTLSEFPYLKEKWHSQELRVSMFNNLIWLKVDDCTDMSSAISLNLLRCLNNLKWLTVSNCDSLEEVFHLEEPNVDEHFGPLLPNLGFMTLIDLPKLQRFCNFTGNIIELPSLHLMRIENCPNMEVFVSISTSVHMIANKESQGMTSEENFPGANIQHFFDEKVAFPRLKELKLFKMAKLLHLQKERLECSKLAQSWVSFENLTTLEISDCEGMRSLMTLSTAESMLKLTIREMTQQAREDVKTDIGIVFVHLKYLKLDRLPSLTCFCVGSYTLEFSSFVQVLVRFPL